MLFSSSTIDILRRDFSQRMFIYRKDLKKSIFDTNKNTLNFFRRSFGDKQ